MPVVSGRYLVGHGLPTIGCRVSLLPRELLDPETVVGAMTRKAGLAQCCEDGLLLRR